MGAHTHTYLWWICYMAFPLFGCCMSGRIGLNKESVSIFICIVVYVTINGAEQRLQYIVHS